MYLYVAFVFWICKVPDPESRRELIVALGSEVARCCSMRLLVLARSRFHVGPTRQGSGLMEEAAVQNPGALVGEESGGVGVGVGIGTVMAMGVGVGDGVVQPLSVGVPPGRHC